MEKEVCTKEPIGSDEGTILCVVTKTKGGISLEANGSPWEMLNIAATIIDTVSVQTQTSIEDTIGAFVEILAQTKPTEKEEN